MKSETDSLINSCLHMLRDPDRADADKVALAALQLTLVVARRRAARLKRAMGRTVAEFGMSLPDHDAAPDE